MIWERFRYDAWSLLAIVVFATGTHVRAQTVASFTANPTSGCVPLTVNFFDNSTNANAYFWDFGNGNTSTLPNPTTVYLNSGFYTVMLVAMNTLTNQRDTFIAQNYIHVVPAPTTFFTATPLSACINNHTIQFNNLTSGAISYIWDFGDGNTSTAVSPSHVYSHPGTYTIKLVSTNGFGCSTIQTRNNYITIHPKPTATFSVNATSTCNPQDVFQFSSPASGISAWYWDFGDGNTSTVQNPTHIYGTTGSFTVTLIVTSNNGCKDTLIRPNYINIGNSLIPNFTATQLTGCNTLTTVFTALVQNASSWLWNFGDGSPPSTLPNPTHTYTAPGSYTVTLTVTTTNGCNGTASYPNAIVVDPMPVPSFTVSQPNPCNYFTFQFNNNSTNAVSYLWNFGNGNVSTQTSPLYTYPNTGSYHVTLTAISPNGCTASTTVNNAVVIPVRVANFNAVPRVGCKPLQVTFTPTNYPGAVSWYWEFGDGNTSTQQIPTNTYNSLGYFSIKLKITTNQGCVDSVKRNNYVRVVNGQVNYILPDTIRGCAPFSVAFTSPLPGCDTTLWSFGNGDSAFTPSVSYLYTTPGIYTVSFYGSMPGRCRQHIDPFAIVQVFEFLPEPILTISASPCKPYQFQFDNLTPDIVSYVWNFGDGSPPDTSQSPTHVFAQPGTYIVSVTLTNIHGCVKTVTTTVTVGMPNPIQVLNNSGCVNTPVQFSVNNPSQFTSLTWNFGDGSPPASTANVSHTYSSPGSYLVTLIATSSAGCTDTFYTGPIAMHMVNASFTAQAPLSGCDTLTVQFTNTSTGAATYLWNFGDGNTSTQTNPVHTYQAPGFYTVVLIATNGNCSKTATHTNLIHIYQATADFTFVSSGSCYPITVNYTDLSANAVSWMWNFGDGTTSTQQHPTHVFTYQPSSPVTLTITDVNGCMATRSKPNITGTVITASIADTLGCRPFTTSFHCNAPGAVSWLWNFGDGNTSTQQNPVHTYTVAGVYTVTLTVTLNNCVSTITLPERVYVVRPQPNFTSPTVAVCAPSLVQFYDQSVGAVQWLWDFGDGTTSTLQHPAHIYSIPGSYTVSLRIWDSLGCTAIRIKNNYINVPGTYAYFTLTSTHSCLNTFVQFTDSSINASTWLWNFGDGHTSTLQHPSHTYQDTGSYIVSLITTDSLGCTSYYTYPNPIVVYPVPTAQGIITSPGEGCTPLTVSFQDQSYAFTSVTWLFGNGDSSTVASPVYTYHNWGTFPVYLVAYNQFGCSDTAFIATVNALLTPTASFTASSTGICPSSQITLISTSTGISNPSYQWSLGNLFSTLTSPSWTLTQPGFYTVTLTVTNDNGCSSSYTQTDFIEVFDTIPPAVTPILSVSVLSNTSVEIKWMPSTVSDLYEYRLYRYNQASGNYDHIYSLMDTSNANPVFNPEYTDTGLNTLHNVYSYKVQTVDRCLYHLPLSYSQAHTTINVAAQPVGTSIRVTWTPYGGCAVSYYEINRSDLNGGPWQSVGTVAGNSPLQFLDTTLYCPFPHSYRITAYDLCGNPYSSWSDTSVATPENILAGQRVEVIRSTVMFNKSILTEWSAPNIAPERVWQYDIYRSTDNLNFVHLASVPAGTYSYLDHDVNVNKNQYFYRVDVVNDCLLSGLHSNEGSSILLRSDWFNYQTHLKWTPYQKWENDVDYYIIEKRNSDGQWIPIKIVEGSQTQTTLDE